MNFLERVSDAPSALYAERIRLAKRAYMKWWRDEYDRLSRLIEIERQGDPLAYYPFDEDQDEKDGWTIEEARRKD